MKKSLYQPFTPNPEFMQMLGDYSGNTVNGLGEAGVRQPTMVEWAPDTDAPFAETSKRQFGVDEFCSRCRVCENACPPLAIKPKKSLVRGVNKWFVDFDSCIPFFAGA